MTTNLVGKTLGQYELIEIVGEGGLATVYKAREPSLERWVAVKVLEVNEREMLARFKREAKAVAQLRHRNILMVYHYDEKEGWPYIAMEFVEGGTLAHRLQGEPMDWIKVIKLAIPMAEALHYAHGQGLIHRDVKPSNILMAQEDWPLLADFGLVKVSDAEQPLTVSGIVMGTPAYISPEQALSETVELQADMYSLGVIMFEMITGREPFEYENPNLLMLAHISEPVPSPRQLNHSCPPELEEIILTAMQKSPEDRYPDMQGMVDALKDVLATSTAPVSSADSSSFRPSAGPASRTPTRPLVTPPEATGPAPDSSPVQADESSPQVARILLPDKNVTLPLPDLEPEGDGLIIGRTHGESQAEIDLGPYGAVDAGISRRHARLIRQGNDWLIEDLGSLNGTYVNDIMLSPGTSVILKNGDVIRCSLMPFVFLMSFKT